MLSDNSSDNIRVDILRTKSNEVLDAFSRQLEAYMSEPIDEKENHESIMNERLSFIQKVEQDMDSGENTDTLCLNGIVRMIVCGELNRLKFDINLR